jgi:uncharacterized protein YbcI
MDAEARRLMLRSISDGIVGLHREHFGRGSDSVRSIMQEDYVVTFLRDVFTPAEKTLIGAGHFEQVRQTRQLFQDALAPKFKDIVTSATGRPVVAFFSQTHSEPDMAVEVFVLAPAGGRGAG